MNTSSHSRTFGLFAYIYSAIQAIFSFLAGAYLLFAAIVLVALADGMPRMQWLIVLLSAGIVMLLLVGSILSMALNLKMGMQLRGVQPPSRSFVISTSILNVCCFFTAGLALTPLGIALGIFGLWFALSRKGNQNLSTLQNELKGFSLSYAAA